MTNDGNARRIGAPSAVRRAVFWLALRLALSACGARTSKDEPPPPPNASDMIVALPDKATMDAPTGTLARQILDWLASDTGDSKTFDVAERLFIPGRSQLTADAIGRVPRLGAMLHAYPDATVEISCPVASTGDPQRDKALSEEPEQAIALRLVDNGLLPDRIAYDDVDRSNAQLEAREGEHPQLQDGIVLRITRHRPANG
ncbi:hypothetical protein ACU5AX_00090 [Sphingomonas sp. XXL09]|uniref:hypothetical protein n=1 Tax=Sphingomonas sp. XXL09 TaxID=3457787 RepID=UPI00406BC9E6